MGGTSRRSSPRIATSLPKARPGEPYLRSPGGRGFEVIWAAVSVSPMVSIRTRPKRSSKARCTSGERGAEAERAKRTWASDSFGGGPSASAARRRYWYCVGTAENQVQRCSITSSQKRLTEKRGGATIEAPVTSVLISDTQKPLMW